MVLSTRAGYRAIIIISTVVFIAVKALLACTNIHWPLIADLHTLSGGKWQLKVLPPPTVLMISSSA